MIVLASGLLLFSVAGLAQSNSGPATGPLKPASSVPGKTPNLPAGTSLFVLTIGAWDMQPLGSSETTESIQIDNAKFMRYSTALGGTALFGHVHLPAGVLIDHIEVDACDEDPTYDIAFPQLLTCVDSSDGPGPCTTIDTITVPSGTPGCYFARGTLNLNYTIQDNANNDYMVTLGLPNSTLVGLRGMKIYYLLQVSPPPATPTFNDVPTTHPFYKFIEALAASGITAGCSTAPPLYCPDKPLTRGEMAVFLATALGLQWGG
jgi:hypothetical protein